MSGVNAECRTVLIDAPVRFCRCLTVFRQQAPASWVRGTRSPARTGRPALLARGTTRHTADSSRLLDHCNILLGHAVHLVVGGVHLVQATGRFAGGCSDFGSEYAHLLDRGGDGAKRYARLIDKLDPVFDRAA